MAAPSSNLSIQLTHLRSATQAVETCAWVPDAVYALIMACFERIFGSLEKLILLWQSGNLPAIPTCKPSSNARHRAPNQAPHRLIPSRAATGRAGQCPNIRTPDPRNHLRPVRVHSPRQTRVTRAPIHAVSFAPPGAVTLSTQQHPARAPPPACGDYFRQRESALSHNRI